MTRLRHGNARSPRSRTMQNEGRSSEADCFKEPTVHKVNVDVQAQQVLLVHREAPNLYYELGCGENGIVISRLTL